MADDEDQDEQQEAPQEEEKSTSKGPKKKFEVKRWNAVALWAWGKFGILFWNALRFALDIVVDNCAICRNHIMDLCIECQANQASATSEGIKLFICVL